MRLLQHENPTSAASYISMYLSSQITLHRGPQPFILGLLAHHASASISGVLTALISQHQAGQVSFRNVVVFVLDSDSGAAQSSNKQGEKQGFNTYLHERFFRVVDVAAENVHFPGEEGCRKPGEYERLIHSLGGVDVMLCDGGVGVCESGSGSVKDGLDEPRTGVVVPLAVPMLLADRQYLEEQRAEAVPAGMGMATVLQSRELIIATVGGEMAAAVKDAIEGPRDSSNPLGVLLLKHGNAVLVVDNEAAAELSANTLEHFLHAEEIDEKFWYAAAAVVPSAGSKVKAKL